MHFPALGAFSLKFSIAPSGQTTDRIKKVRGCKNGMDLLYHNAKYGGDRGSCAGYRRKTVMFFVRFFVLVRFTMYFCWVFMEISKPVHFWKDYNMRNLKTNVYICEETSMAAILDFQNGRHK